MEDSKTRDKRPRLRCLVCTEHNHRKAESRDTTPLVLVSLELLIPQLRGPKADQKRLLGNGYNEKPVKPHVIAAEQLLADEESRRLLLDISRRFEDTGRGRMSTRRTETAKVVHGPAWQSFVVDSLRVEDSRQPHITKMTRLFKDMTSASMMQVHTRVSNLLRAEEGSNNDDLGEEDGNNESGMERVPQEAYNMSNEEGIEADLIYINKPDNIMKRPAGQKTHPDGKVATPPETPAAMPVARSSRIEIVDGQIVIGPKKKAVKKSRTLTKAPAKVAAQPTACGPSKASTQNTHSYTGSTAHPSLGKENKGPVAKRRRVGSRERDEVDGPQSVVNVSSAEG